MSAVASLECEPGANCKARELRIASPFWRRARRAHKVRSQTRKEPSLRRLLLTDAAPTRLQKNKESNAPEQHHAAPPRGISSFPSVHARQSLHVTRHSSVRMFSGGVFRQSSTPGPDSGEAGKSCPGWPQVGRLARGEGWGISPRPGSPGAPPPTRAVLPRGW